MTDMLDAKAAEKTLNIDFLYLDLQVCERCMGTDDVLLSALEDVRDVLKAAGYQTVLNKVEIEDENLAKQHRFLSSPTIRINGHDICLEVKENPCGPCSDLGNNPVECRVFVYEGKEYEVPPKAMIINAILTFVYGGNQLQMEDHSNQPYTLPENLRKFFEGRKNKEADGCGCGCGCGSSCC